MNLPSTIVFLLLLGIEPICNTASAETLLDARQGFSTTLVKKDVDGAPVPDPPRNVLQSVKYNSPIGDLAAYITPSPQDGKRHPAIIWIIGGFSNGIDETAWASATPDNDQSASTFRDAGIIMMYPSFNVLLKASANPLIHFYSIRGKNHFSTVAPITKVIGTKILLDDGPSSNIEFTEEELNGRSRIITHGNASKSY